MFQSIARLQERERERMKDSSSRCNGVEHVPSCSTWPPAWLAQAPLPPPAVAEKAPEVEHGDAWEPPEDRLTIIPAPVPPAGARLCFQDARCRPCSPGEATMWTWVGASRWFHVADWPIPWG